MRSLQLGGRLFRPHINMRMNKSLIGITPPIRYFSNDQKQQTPSMASGTKDRLRRFWKGPVSSPHPQKKSILSPVPQKVVTMAPSTATTRTSSSDSSFWSYFWFYHWFTAQNDTSRAHVHVESHISPGDRSDTKNYDDSTHSLSGTSGSGKNTNDSVDSSGKDTHKSHTGMSSHHMNDHGGGLALGLGAAGVVGGMHVMNHMNHGQTTQTEKNEKDSKQPIADDKKEIHEASLGDSEHHNSMDVGTTESSQPSNFIESSQPSSFIESSQPSSFIESSQPSSFTETRSGGSSWFSSGSDSGNSWSSSDSGSSWSSSDSSSSWSSSDSSSSWSSSDS